LVEPVATHDLHEALRAEHEPVDRSVSAFAVGSILRLRSASSSVAAATFAPPVFDNRQ
jgi:hypothetical protein